VLAGELIVLPYIKTRNRAKYSTVLRELIKMLKAVPPEEVDGELNYVVTKLLKEIYPLRYFHINKAVGVLECAKLEYYRRVAAPYEDKKIQESGDV
jgi:ribosomal protein S3AE